MYVFLRSRWWLCMMMAMTVIQVISKKYSIWHVPAFIYILSISIQQLLFRHKRWPQEYFYISCGTIFRKLNKTPWKILCFPPDDLRRMAPGICNIMGNMCNFFSTFNSLCLFVVGMVTLFRFPTVLTDVSSLHSGFKFFVQAYGCTRHRLQKLLQKFRNHTHFVVVAPLLKLCEVVHLRIFLNVLFA